MHEAAESLPKGLVLVRTTREFDESTIPRGLLHEHRIAAGVWGRLVVSAGSLTFAFDGVDAPPEVHVAAPGSQIIPPGVPHHVVIDGPVRFVVEFHEQPDGDTLTT